MGERRAYVCRVALHRLVEADLALVLICGAQVEAHPRDVKDHEALELLGSHEAGEGVLQPRQQLPDGPADSEAELQPNKLDPVRFNGCDLPRGFATLPMKRRRLLGGHKAGEGGPSSPTVAP